MSNSTKTTLLIIGAGPFGLALAAHAKSLGIDCIIAGNPMEFWRKNMPEGMLLRSTCDWHLDTNNEHTIDRFLETQSQTCKDAEPLSLQFYLNYTQWFIQQKQLNISSLYITRLDQNSDNSFTAVTNDGTSIHAKYVVSAVGLTYFKHIPGEVTACLPSGSYEHTCDMVNMELMKNKRVLIIGGRQSAFEWAALLHEAGAAQVHVSHRHASPEFKTSDWSWVNELCYKLDDDSLWFRNSPQEEQDAIAKKLWNEGRLKLEPWLKDRIQQENIQLWPHTQVVACNKLADQSLEVRFDNNETIIVDNMILATGYKVNVSNIPFFAQGNILAILAVKDGFPVLDGHFQTSIPGLFITGIPASKDFGPFFGFTIATRTSAKIIGSALVNKGI